MVKVSKLFISQVKFSLEVPLKNFFGIASLFKFLQSEKASLPMKVTESGIVMLVSELQPRKARRSMEVTELGMFMLVNKLQSLKALSPMDVTEKLFATEGI